MQNKFNYINEALYIRVCYKFAYLVFYLLFLILEKNMIEKQLEAAKKSLGKLF